MEAGPLYVYGVIRTSDAIRLDVKGVQRASVSLVRDGDMAALVSPVSGDALVAAREVRSHWTVLQAVIEQVTVIPVRFGTVIESAEALRERLLEANAHRLAPLLAELAGTIQVTVKGDYVMDELLREIVRRSPALARLRERVRALPDDAGYYHRIRLGELISAAIEDQRALDTDLAFTRLEPGTRNIVVEPTVGADGAFNLAALIERRRERSFGKRVAALAEEFGERASIRYVGPLPPYSFADAELQERSAAWA